MATYFKLDVILSLAACPIIANTLIDSNLRFLNIQIEETYNF